MGCKPLVINCYETVLKDILMHSSSLGHGSSQETNHNGSFVKIEQKVWQIPNIECQKALNLIATLLTIQRAGDAIG